MSTLLIYVGTSFIYIEKLTEKH